MTCGVLYGESLASRVNSGGYKRYSNAASGRDGEWGALLGAVLLVMLIEQMKNNVLCGNKYSLVVNRKFTGESYHHSSSDDACRGPFRIDPVPSHPHQPRGREKRPTKHRCWRPRRDRRPQAQARRRRRHRPCPPLGSMISKIFVA